MLVTQKLEIWISSVSFDTYKQSEHAPVVCINGKFHIEQRTVKGRWQKLGIRIAYMDGEGLLPTEGNTAALAYGISSSSQPFLYRKIKKYTLNYVLTYFMHVLAYGYNI